MEKIPETIEYRDSCESELLEVPFDMYPGAAIEMLRKKINEIIDCINRRGCDW